MQASTLHVAYVAPGYPSVSKPVNSIFIHRSIKALAENVEPLVIQVCGWKPDRKLIVHRTWEEVPVIQFAVPHFPSYKLGRFNAFMISMWGILFLKTYLRNLDLLHSISVYPLGFAVNYWAKALGKVHVTQAIGRDVNLYLKKPSFTKIHWLNDIGGISCNTVAFKNRLESLAPHQTNMPVIHRGVDTSMFTPLGTAIGPQAKLPPLRFLYLGGFQTWKPKEYDLVNYKGGHVLLEAWRQAEADLGSSSLIIGGLGSDPSCLQGWLSGVEKPQNVYILPTIIPLEVPGYLRACDVVVLPSVTDGLPNLANEAQACERPVLGTDAGGIPETVIHGETGWIVRRADPQALAQGLLWFYKHQDEIDRIGKAGRQRMINYFNWGKYIEDTMGFYRCALSKV